MMTFVIVSAAFLAAVLTLFSGFGLGTILMPVVAIFFPLTVAVAMTALVHLLNNLFKLALLWSNVNWPVVWRFGIPALVATVPGAWLLTHLSALPGLHAYTFMGADAVITPVKLMVGLLLILFATLEWLPVLKNMNLSSSLSRLAACSVVFSAGYRDIKVPFVAPFSFAPVWMPISL